MAGMLDGTILDQTKKNRIEIKKASSPSREALSHHNCFTTVVSLLEEYILHNGPISPLQKLTPPRR